MQWKACHVKRQTICRLTSNKKNILLVLKKLCLIKISRNVIKKTPFLATTLYFFWQKVLQISALKNTFKLSEISSKQTFKQNHFNDDMNLKWFKDYIYIYIYMCVFVYKYNLKWDFKSWNPCETRSKLSSSQDPGFWMALSLVKTNYLGFFSL